MATSRRRGGTSSRSSRQAALFNPFPGLRPFEPDEDHLFFGRETEIDDLLRRLRSSRFLAVVGASGSGKSSLVKSGLIPALQSGFMAGAGSRWRIAMLRPGEDPVGHLAAALDAPHMLGGEAELASTNRVLIETTLRRGTLGLAEAVRDARLPPGDNVLVVIDQFEELFRFRRNRQITHARDESILLVKLLLEASRQQALPIYVVLTMRSDFIGDCMDFPGLSDAVNAGLYLVGRMTRDALRSAITGPVAVAGGSIAPRLVNRVLNDVGDDHDQLPLVQHALMRTFEQWARTRRDGAPIDIEDYETVGTIRNALSLHAEEAYDEAAGAGHGALTARVFKALTDTFSDARGVRRPTSMQELTQICDAPEANVTAVVETFRRPGRSFLMPPHVVPLTRGAIVDLSHESLMRCWLRLIEWAEEERDAAAFYVRLAQAARWFELGTAGRWGNPELQLAERWQRDNQPSRAWALRYDPSYDRAMHFLAHSREEQRRAEAERERQRLAKLRRTQWTAAVLGVLLTAAVMLAVFALNQRRRAETNLDLARAAVDELLGSADRDPSRIGADVPQVEAFRRELLDRAGRFYQAFMNQQPRSEQSSRDLAFAHLRRGDIHRMLDEMEQAATEYRTAIAAFAELARRYPDDAAYRQALASSYNWLGETLRLRGVARADADSAYASALRLQRALVAAVPADSGYRKELARTLYNRGILMSDAADGAAASESHFREAIGLLEPLAAADVQAAQEVARVYNNLASLPPVDGPAAAESLYRRAIAVHERLVAADEENRQYKLELADFNKNLATVLVDRGAAGPALEHSRRALDLLDALARAAPSLTVERADARSLRGWILESADPGAARLEYELALERFEAAAADPNSYRLPRFHERFGELIVSLAMFPPGGAEASRARALLGRATDTYGSIVRAILARDAPTELELAYATLGGVLASLPQPQRNALTALYDELAARLNRNNEDGSRSRLPDRLPEEEP